MVCDKSWGSEVLVTLHTTLNLKAGAASPNNDSINTIIKISLRFLHKKRMGAGKPPKSSWSYRMKFLAADFVQSRPSLSIFAPLFQYLPLSFNTCPRPFILAPVFLYLALFFYICPCLYILTPVFPYLSLSFYTCPSLSILAALFLYLPLSLYTCPSLSTLVLSFYTYPSLFLKLVFSFYTCPSLSVLVLSFYTYPTLFFTFLFLYLPLSFYTCPSLSNVCLPWKLKILSHSSLNIKSHVISTVNQTSVLLKTKSW